MPHRISKRSVGTEQLAKGAMTPAKTQQSFHKHLDAAERGQGRSKSKPHEGQHVYSSFTGGGFVFD